MSLIDKLLAGTVDPLMLHAALTEWDAGELDKASIVSHWSLDAGEVDELQTFKDLFSSITDRHKRVGFGALLVRIVNLSAEGIEDYAGADLIPRLTRG